MASSGKKGKKTKGKTVALNEFLANKSDDAERVKTSWADTDADSDYHYRNKEKPVVLPTAPRATREPQVIDEARIPNEAPFVAYISNLPYDVDKEDISEFFKGLGIKSIRLPTTEEGGSRLKGCGFVEFHDRESLREALHFVNRDIKGRLIGVDVSDGKSSMGRDSKRGGMGRDMDAPDRTLGNWRSGPRDEDYDRDRGGFGFRDRGGVGGGRRDFGGGFRERESGVFRDGGGIRDGEGGGFRDREGGGFREREGGGFREREGGGFREREGGGFREREGGGFREREGGGFRDREGGGFRDREGGDRWGGDRDFGRREAGFSRRGYEERDDQSAAEREMARTRPKLQLAPRTKPPEEKKPEMSQSSIFGGAKPVDTAAREREIEERLNRERSTDAPVSRDVEPRRAKSPNEEWDEDRSRKENVWTRRSQRPLDNQQQDEEERRELSKDRSENDYEEKPPASPTEQGPKEKLEAPLKPKAQAPAVGREPAKMPELVEKGPPNFAVANKFASLPDEDPAESSE